MVPIVSETSQSAFWTFWEYQYLLIVKPYFLVYFSKYYYMLPVLGGYL